MLKYQSVSVVFQEVPDEVTLAFSIANCGRNCEGCHSPSLNKNSGFPLKLFEYKQFVDFYKPYITCVCLLGDGQASPAELQEYFAYAKQQGLKTCLYTADNIEKFASLAPCLDYLKTGAYIQRLGSLTSPTTNQRFFQFDGNTAREITYKFQIKALRKE